MSDSFLGENLIFIISQPRSGSTLLQRVLAGNPDVQTSAETWLMLHPVYGKKSQAVKSEFNSSWAQKAVEEFLDHYTDGREVYDDAIRAWAEVIYKNALKQNNKKYFLDKTPRYFFIIKELYELFPRAKFVFLIRNPMAVLASELKTYVKDDWPVLGLFAPDLIDAPRLILDGIDLLGENAITIHYEKFVKDPEANISLLCQKLGIEFYREMLDYSDTHKPVGKFNDSTGINQHTTANTGSVAKWKAMVDDNQSLFFARCYLAAIGKETICKLGYNYQEIYDLLYSRNLSTQKLYPWSIAIQSQSQWTLRQHFVSDLHFNQSKYGTLKGTFVTTKKSFKKLARRVITAFSMPDK